jgi:intracellular sulfur oxidation DsrE/DsrF family protein
MVRSRSVMAVFAILLTMFAAFWMTAGIKMAQAAVEKEKPDAKHRVVIEVTRDGAEQWTAALNYVENLRKSFGVEHTEIEVVGHNAGLGMMLLKDVELSDRMKKLAHGGVILAACENTMRMKRVTQADLLPFVTTVDSGVAEVVRKQEAGWAYLKSGV